MQTAQKELKYYGKPTPPSKRIVKMDGNVAYISSGFAKKVIPQPVATTKPIRKAAAKPKTAAKVNRSSKGALVSTLIVCFIAFCALAVLVSRFAMVCSIGSGINDLEQSIEETKADIEALQVEMEMRDDLDYIRNTARDKLDMTYPEQEQKRSIDLSG